MTLLICYIALTALVVLLWFLFVGLDDLKTHSLLATLGCAGIVAVIWPVLALMVLACIGLSGLNSIPHSR